MASSVGNSLDPDKHGGNGKKRHEQTTACADQVENGKQRDEEGAGILHRLRERDGKLNWRARKLNWRAGKLTCRACELNRRAGKDRTDSFEVEVYKPVNSDAANDSVKERGHGKHDSYEHLYIWELGRIRAGWKRHGNENQEQSGEHGDQTDQSNPAANDQHGVARPAAQAEEPHRGDDSPDRQGKTEDRDHVHEGGHPGGHGGGRGRAGESAGSGCMGKKAPLSAMTKAISN